MRFAQIVGLCFAASFGHRLGEVRKEHREPEPESDLQFEPVLVTSGIGATMPRMKWIVVKTLPTSTTNMTGILHHLARIQFDERIDDRSLDDLPVPDCLFLFFSVIIAYFLALCIGLSLRVYCDKLRASSPSPLPKSKCLSCLHQQVLDDRSQTQRREKCQAPTITITLTSSAVKSGVVTGNVPSDGGTVFLRARFPAIASIGMIMKNRPTNIAMPIVVLYQSVFAEMPAKAEPLLPVPEVNA